MLVCLLSQFTHVLAYSCSAGGAVGNQCDCLPTSRGLYWHACRGLLCRHWGGTSGGPFSHQVCKWCCSLYLRVPDTGLLDGIRVVQLQPVVNVCVCPWPCPSDNQLVSQVYQLLQSQQGGWSPELISPWETHAAFSAALIVQIHFPLLASFLVTSFSVQTSKGLMAPRNLHRSICYVTLVSILGK